MQTIGYGVNSKVVSVLPITLKRISGYFQGAADRFIQIHNAKELPANGTVPIYSQILQAQFSYDWDFEDIGLRCATGCVVAVSSTEETLTAISDVAQEMSVHALFDSPYDKAESALYISPVAIAEVAGTYVASLYDHASVRIRPIEITFNAAWESHMWVTLQGTNHDSFVGYRLRAGETKMYLGPDQTPAALNFTVNVRETNAAGTEQQTGDVGLVYCL